MRSRISLARGLVIHLENVGDEQHHLTGLQRFAVELVTSRELHEQRGCIRWILVECCLQLRDRPWWFHGAHFVESPFASRSGGYFAAMKTVAELMAAALTGDEEDEAAWDAIRELHQRGGDEVFDAAVELLRSSSPKRRSRGVDVHS